MTFTRPLRLAALAALVLLSACTTVEKPPVRTTSGPEFTPAAFEEARGVDTEHWRSALAAFRQSCTAIGSRPVWAGACSRAAAVDPAAAEDFFRANFTPWRVATVERDDRGDEVKRTETGLTTGYFEPLLYGSRTKQAPFVHPIYGVPDDLLIIDLAEIYPELKGKRLRGKLDGRRVVPYDTRGVIQNRTDLEPWAIAWVDDPVAAFFLQVQGSGRILLPDGSFMRVGFADQNGYRYRSIGNWLVKNSELKSHELSMQQIRAWTERNPDRVKEALAQNPSFIFFEERHGDPSLGPTGAQGVPLTAQASVAVDPSRWTLGTPFIIEVKQDRPALAFTRPVVAQDTGGAIRGLIRFDYFWGFGDEAGEASAEHHPRLGAGPERLHARGHPPEALSALRKQNARETAGVLL